MKFTYTYRDKDGLRCHGEVSAPNRAVAFSLVKGQGIHPIGMEECRGQESRKMYGQSFHDIGKFIVQAGLIAGLVLLGYLFFPADTLPQQADSAVSREKKKPASVEPVRHVGTPTAQRSSGKSSGVVSRRTISPTRLAPSTAKTVAGDPQVISVVTNEAGFVLTTIVNAAGETNVLTQTQERQTFTNPVNQLIAAAINGAYNGGEMAPLPPMGPAGEAAFREAIKMPIVDQADDPTEVKRLKQAVREARGEMLKLLDSGQSVDEILTQHRELWNENISIRAEIKEEYRKVVASGDLESAEAYRLKINETFMRMGIPELTEADGLSKKKKRRMK